MSKDYNQMALDMTLESERSLKDNVQTTIKFALGQIMEYDHPTAVRNRHEGYGIAAEQYTALSGKVKQANGDMQTMLKLLPNGDGDMINIAGSLYNSAAEIAVEAIKLAAQAQRVINDLYEAPAPTPLEDYLSEMETAEAAEDGFEDASNVEAEEE